MMMYPSNSSLVYDLHYLEPDDSLFNFTNKSLDLNKTDQSLPHEFICILDMEPEDFFYSSSFQTCIYCMYVIVFLVALSGNGLVCLVVQTTPGMKTVTNFFIVNLAVGDILMTILCVPISFMSMLVLRYWPFGAAMCKIVNFSQAVSVLVSAYTLLAICIDRYMVITRPLKLRLGKTAAKVIVGLIWIGASVTAAPIFVVSELQKPSLWHEVCEFLRGQTGNRTLLMTNEAHGHSRDCYADVLSPIILPQWSTGYSHTARNATATLSFYAGIKDICAEEWPTPGQSERYTCALLTLQFALPLTVLVCTYARIACVVLGKRPPGEAESIRDTRIQHSKRKMLKMMVIVVIVFIVCWLPLNLFIVLWTSHEDEEELGRWPVTPYLWFASHWLAMSHSCYNPIIYCYMNTRYREGFKRV